MRTFFKYLLILLPLFSLTLYFIFNSYLSKYLSMKSQKEIVIYNIDVRDYPIINVVMKINQHKMDIKSEINYSYSDGFRVKGVTSEFGGNLYFNYDKNQNKIVFRLEKLSLEKVLKSFSYPVRMTANLFGTITYDIKHKILVFDNILKKAQLKRNSMTDMVLTVSKIDMTQYLYDKSSFIGFYQDAILGGTLKLDSGEEHIILDKLHLHTKTKEITSKVDLKMEGQKFFASISGTTDNPQFNIDMSKILEYQLEKNSKKIKSLFNDSF